MSQPTITTSLPEIVERLSAFFPSDDVKSFPMTVKRDKTAALAAFYIDARAVMNRLDETCYWRNEYKEDPRGSGKSILCGISVLVSLPDGSHEWLTRWDGADNTDIEATKGGLSGASRRAAVQWGIGRYLYNVPGQWCDLKDGKYFVRTPRIPAQFLPAGASRAQKAKPANVAPPKSAAKAKPAKAEGLQLTSAQVKQFAAWKPQIGVAASKKLYGAVLKGTITFDEAITQANALIADKLDK